MLQNCGLVIDTDNVTLTSVSIGGGTCGTCIIFFEASFITNRADCGNYGGDVRDTVRAQPNNI